jgi:hypothetical protein
MKRIGIDIDFDNMTEDDFVEVEEKVSFFLQMNGFDADYNPSAEGVMCEGILDKLS